MKKLLLFGVLGCALFSLNLAAIEKVETVFQMTPEEIKAAKKSMKPNKQILPKMVKFKMFNGLNVPIEVKRSSWASGESADYIIPAKKMREISIGIGIEGDGWIYSFSFKIGGRPGYTIFPAVEFTYSAAFLGDELYVLNMGGVPVLTNRGLADGLKLKVFAPIVFMRSKYDFMSSYTRQLKELSGR